MKTKNLSKKQNQALYTIIGMTTAAIVCVLVLQFYNSNNNNKKILEASTVYQRAMMTNDSAKSSFDDKVSKFRSVVDKYPNTSFSILASWHLARLYVAPKKLDIKNLSMSAFNMLEAVKVLQQSINNNPHNSLTKITKIRLAKLYLTSKQPDQAIKVLQSSSFLENSAYALMLLGQAYNQKNDKTKAAQTWQKALQYPEISADFKKILTRLINNFDHCCKDYTSS